MSEEIGNLPIGQWTKFPDAKVDYADGTWTMRVNTEPTSTDGTAYVRIHPDDLDKIRAIVAEELHKIVMRFGES